MKLQQSRVQKDILLRKGLEGESDKENWSKTRIKDKDNTYDPIKVIKRLQLKRRHHGLPETDTGKLKITALVIDTASPITILPRTSTRTHSKNTTAHKNNHQTS